MGAFDKIIRDKEAELNVKFPPLCIQAVNTIRLSKIAAWEVWPPTIWTTLEKVLDGQRLPIALEDGCRAIAIGNNIGGSFFFLKSASNMPSMLQEEVYELPIGSSDYRLVGNSLMEADLQKSLLKEANKLLGPKRAIVDEEDTF